MRNPWTRSHMVAAAALVLAAMAVQWRAWVDIAQIAMGDEEASHIILVPFVAIWMVWVRRGRLRSVVPRHNWIGPAIMLGGWLMSYYGFYHAMQAAWHAGAILMAIGAALTILGSDVLLKFLPAFVVLGFLVPVPGMIRLQLAGPLQTATAAATENVLELFGADVVRSGNLLMINGVQVAIAEACNGMRMVFALLLVSYGFAFGTPLRQYVRFLILAASPLSAIACNVVRLIPTVLVYGHMTDNFAEKFHDATGWVMLPIAFLILLGIIRLLRWALLPVSPFTLAYE
jgi:exosortase